MSFNLDYNPDPNTNYENRKFIVELIVLFVLVGSFCCGLYIFGVATGAIR